MNLGHAWCFGVEKNFFLQTTVCSAKCVKNCLAIYNFKGALAFNSKSTPITTTTMQIENIIPLLLKFIKKKCGKGGKNHSSRGTVFQLLLVWSTGGKRDEEGESKQGFLFPAKKRKGGTPNFHFNRA